MPSWRDSDKSHHACFSIELVVIVPERNHTLDNLALVASLVILLCLLQLLVTEASTHRNETKEWATRYTNSADGINVRSAEMKKNNPESIMRAAPCLAKRIHQGDVLRLMPPPAPKWTDLSKSPCRKNRLAPTRDPVSRLAVMGAKSWVRARKMDNPHIVTRCDRKSHT